MRFQIDSTKHKSAAVAVSHRSQSTDLRLTVKYKCRDRRQLNLSLTREEARALAGGIVALLHGKPE